MPDLAALLAKAAEEAARYRASLPERPVWPAVSGEDVRATLDVALQDGPREPHAVIDELIAAVEPGLVASAGPRYFGFVTGGALDAATAADMLATGWDQLAFNRASSPAAMAVEEVAAGWLKSLLGIPATASCGFVTGAQEANTVGLAAARHHVLAEAGWDVERDGLMGAPRVRVIAGAERHATLDRALRLLGFGAACVE